jgi:hypothetical protein
MSNLTGRPVVAKGIKRTKGNKPTQAQYARFERIRERGCSVCGMPPEVHHALTGAGKRKDHDKVFALCPLHHRGQLGIHHMGRKAWEPLFGTELEHLERVKDL